MDGWFLASVDKLRVVVRARQDSWGAAPAGGLVGYPGSTDPRVGGDGVQLSRSTESKEASLLQED